MLEIGAEDRNNLEPYSADLLLETLEEWSEVLKHEEELTHTLRQFQKVSMDHADSDDPEDEIDHVVEPPSGWEPSP